LPPNRKTLRLGSKSNSCVIWFKARRGNWNHSALHFVKRSLNSSRKSNSFVKSSRCPARNLPLLPPGVLPSCSHPSPPLRAHSLSRPVPPRHVRQWNRNRHRLFPSELAPPSSLRAV